MVGRSATPYLAGRSKATGERKPRQSRSTSWQASPAALPRHFRSATLSIATSTLPAMPATATSRGPEATHEASPPSKLAILRSDQHLEPTWLEPEWLEPEWLRVDDLTVETSGTPKDAAARCAAALDMLVSILEDQMGFTVSEKKSVIVASNPVLAIAAADMTTVRSITPVKVAELLGTATRAGGRRAVNVLKTRKENFQKI